MQFITEQNVVLMSFICVQIKSCYGYSIDLQFGSSRCFTFARSLTESKSYNLLWNGQNSPQLCEFSFTGGMSLRRRPYKVCFESLLFDISYSVLLKVKNDTGTFSRRYMRTDRFIKKTCLKWAKLTMSLVLPKGYIDPPPKTYLNIKVSASRLEDETTNKSKKYEVVVIYISIVILIAFAIGIFFCIKACRRSGRVREFFGSVVERIGKALCYCFKCKCFDCYCECEDICMPCGECCTAWANCCTNLVSRGECSQNHSSQTTEMDPIPQVSGHIYTSTVVLEPPRPPPDNHALQGDQLSPLRERERRREIQRRREKERRRVRGEELKLSV